MPVRTPFPDIAAHVINSQLIWLLLPHRVRLASAIILEPSHLIECTRPAVLKTFRCLFASTAGILPLCFRRQTKCKCRRLLTIQLLHEILAILPGHLLNRSILPHVFES